MAPEDTDLLGDDDTTAPTTVPDPPPYHQTPEADPTPLPEVDPTPTGDSGEQVQEPAALRSEYPSTAEITDDYVVLKFPQVARGHIATQLLNAADALGLDPRTAVRARTEGFRVPIEIARYVWPSEFGDGK